MNAVDELRMLAGVCKDLRVRTVRLHPDGKLAEFTMSTAPANDVTKEALEAFRRTMTDALPTDQTVTEWSMPGTSVPQDDPASLMAAMARAGAPVVGPTVTVPSAKPIHTARSRKTAAR